MLNFVSARRMPILSNDLLSVPINRLTETFFKINRHPVAQCSLSCFDRGLRVAYVTRSRRFVNRFDVAAEYPFEPRKKIKQSVSTSAGHVKRTARGASRVGSQHVRVDHVFDVGKIA